MFTGLSRGRSAGNGTRGGMGFGFRGSSPPWPYVGRGRGGQPRCAYFKGTRTVTGAASINREEELNFLKNWAQAVKEDLERINSRIHNLESEKRE
jgi:hypothetical protein